VDYLPKKNQMTKCDYVVEQLKERIISGEYKSGDQLPPEAALCELFGVSRITVREALKKLNMMGLVEIKQGKGTFVKSADLGIYMKPLLQLVDFDEIDVETIYTAREYIEGSIAYLAARNRTEGSPCGPGFAGSRFRRTFKSGSGGLPPWPQCCSWRAASGFRPPATALRN